MTEPPHELDGARVLKFARIAADVAPTGRTRHTVIKPRSSTTAAAGRTSATSDEAANDWASVPE
jgi:hypothetical protein